MFARLPCGCQFSRQKHHVIEQPHISTCSRRQKWEQRHMTWSIDSRASKKRYMLCMKRKHVHKDFKSPWSRTKRVTQNFFSNLATVRSKSAWIYIHIRFPLYRYIQICSNGDYHFYCKLLHAGDTTQYTRRYVRGCVIFCFVMVIWSIHRGFMWYKRLCDIDWIEPAVFTGILLRWH